MNAFLAGLILSAGFLAASDTKDRPCVDVRINGRPVRLTIDTGADRLVLFSDAADRIGLKYDKPERGSDPNREKAGRVLLFRSDLCRLKIENSDFPSLRIDGAEGRKRVWVVQTPAGLPLNGVDGAIGWPNLSKGILHIDWGRKALASMPKVPGQTPPWQRFELYSRPDLHVLALRVPASADAREAVYIDTGDSGGVAVCSALWQEIVSQRPELPTALEGSPVYEAGIRNGDKLLRVNGRDMTAWKTNPQGATERRTAFTKPPGTKLNLTLLRDAQPMEVTVVLKELLPIEPALRNPAP
jgi:hypothetical protein